MRIPFVSGILDKRRKEKAAQLREQQERQGDAYVHELLLKEASDIHGELFAYVQLRGYLRVELQAGKDDAEISVKLPQGVRNPFPPRDWTYDYSDILVVYLRMYRYPHSDKKEIHAIWYLGDKKMEESVFLAQREALVGKLKKQVIPAVVAKIDQELLTRARKW